MFKQGLGDYWIVTGTHITNLNLEQKTGEGQIENNQKSPWVLREKKTKTLTILRCGLKLPNDCLEMLGS